MQGWAVARQGGEQARPSCSYPSRGRSREVRENRACAAANLAPVAVDHDVNVGLARSFLGGLLLIWILGSRGYRVARLRRVLVGVGLEDGLGRGARARRRARRRVTGGYIIARERLSVEISQASQGFLGARTRETHTSYNCDETWQQESWDVLSRKQSRPILLVGRYAR